MYGDRQDGQMMQITKYKIQHLFPLVFAILGALVWVLMCGDIATAGYADSAHGDASSGVNRTGAGYDVGSCAHCHDTFDNSTCGVNELMLFASQNDENLCFQCHKGTGSVQQGGITNDNYSKTFGGAPSADFTNVYDAFNPPEGGSSHDLAALLSWAETNHPEWGFTSNSNPCTICHPPHIAKANWRNPQDPTYTAVRRPSEHASSPGNLWGDGTGETMYDNWTFPHSNPNIDTKYEAPYYKSVGNDGYEPGGTFSINGTKHPDYATLCLDCHSEINVTGFDNPIVWATQPGSEYPSNHGKCWELDNRNCIGQHGYWFPKVDVPWPSYDIARVLSCLDCHEPHGSSNPYMLRTTMNGHTDLVYTVGNKTDIINWCDACHKPYDSGHDYEYHCILLGRCQPDDPDPCRYCHTHGDRGDFGTL